MMRAIGVSITAGKIELGVKEQTCKQASVKAAAALSPALGSLLDQHVGIGVQIGSGGHRPQHKPGWFCRHLKTPLSGENRGSRLPSPAARGRFTHYLCDIPTVSLGGHLPGPPPDLQTFSSDCTVASLGSDICIPFSALNFLLFLWAGRQ
ncbi:uncharacterized protein LOC142418961 isoform X5 [Mycteria americana]|uniref:uncharacterized protein LOC142418961 isoform X5 n=1 Tax=Mycteria americana TaxID=33587 RepID=UPI003F58585E